MSENIRMTPSQAIERANTITSYKGEVEAIVGKLRTLITQQLASEWEGKAQVAFSEQFERLDKTAMKPFVVLLESISVQLKSVAAAITQADHEIAGRINK